MVKGAGLKLKESRLEVAYKSMGRKEAWLGPSSASISGFHAFLSCLIV